MSTPYQISERPDLTASLMALTNASRISDLVMPRITTKKTFSYQEFANRAEFNGVHGTTLVARGGDVSQVDFETIARTESTDNHALDTPIPLTDLDEVSFDLEYTKALYVSDCLKNAREVRVAKKVFDKTNFNTFHELSESEVKSGLGELLLELLDRPKMRPNTLALGQSDWTNLRTNEELVQWVNSNSGSKGAITKENLAACLEIDRVLVGNARVKTINSKTKKASVERAWSGFGAFLHIDPNLSDLDSPVPTWGATAESKAPRVVDYFNAEKGQMGTQVIRVLESTKDLVLSKDCGALMQFGDALKARPDA